MLVRNFIPGEETELRRVFMSSVHELARGFYTPEQLDAWAPAVHDEQDWANRIAVLRPFVAIIEDRVAGYADLQDDGYIDHFFVSGEFAARGVGSALMQHVHAVAAKRGLRRLFAQVSLSAEGFFARHGFQVDQRQTVVVAGVHMENSRMSRTLTLAG